MNSVKKVPSYDLFYNLSRLNDTAKAVAYAKSSEEAEYFTVRHLRPQIEAVEAILNEMRLSYKKDKA
jgi:hypothetical protein